ncbi:MAG: hypothetical protein HY017_27865 [Betaproteobacteria bacterium]|nr:hypothetical protein [Betaproteobacteria bacterium]
MTTVGTLTIPGSGTAGRNCIVSLNGGTLKVTGTGTLNFSGTAAQAQFAATGGSTVELNGNFGTTAGTPTWTTADTINFKGGVLQTMGAYSGANAYGNVKINNTAGTVRFSTGTTLVAGQLDVQVGTLDIRSSSPTINGATNVSSGAAITFTNSSTGNKTFKGLVTIDGTWTNTAVNESPFFEGGLKFNGDGVTNTFSSGTGTYTFQGASNQDISGSGAMTFSGTVAITTAITVSNKNTNAAGITAAGAITGISGTNWTQNTNAYLKVSGALLTTAGTVLNASNSGNTIEYAGAAQTIKNPSSNTYHHLKLSGSGAMVMPGNALTINGNFSFSGTAATTATAGGAMTVAGNFTIGTNATFTAITAIGTSGFTHSVGGDWQNDATFTANRSTISFNGGAAQAIKGTSATTFRGLTIANTSGDVTITTSPTVTGLLTFTSGKIATGSNVVIVDVTTISRSGTISTGGVPSTTVTGSGTAFTTQLVPGDQLFTTAGTLLGTIASITSATQLTLSAAATITAGTSYHSTGGTITNPSSARYVNGCVRKNFQADAASPFQTFTYPIGDTSNYTPVTQAFSTSNTVGDVTACTAATDHDKVTNPIDTTGIDKAKSVNRYWTLTANSGGTGTPSGTFDATFTFVAGDLTDPAGPNTANFIIERYVSASTAWFPTTLVSAGGSSTTGTTAGYGDFAIGEPLSGFTPVPGNWNAFETSAPTAAILGKIKTKVAAAASGNLGIAAIANGAVSTGFTGQVDVWLVDSSDNTGTLTAATGCRTTWKFLGTAIAVEPYTSAPPALPNGDTQITFVAGDLGRRNDLALSAVQMPADAYQDLRLFMRDHASGALKGCSTDRFAVRPKDLVVDGLDATWLTSGTGRTLNNSGPVHAAGATGSATSRPFTLRATARNNSATTTTNYAGTPTVKTAASCGTLCSTPGTLTIGTWSAASGVATAGASYDEAGTFTLTLEDATYASVDTTDGLTTASEYTIPQATPAPDIGRFVPDSFTVATTAPVPKFRTFDSTCVGTRSFTYVGQPFAYVTAPLATVTAINAGGGTTTNYRGALWKITTSAPTDVTQTYSNNGVGPSLDESLAKTAPTITPGNGTGTVQINATDTLAYVRSATTPIAEFTSNISLAVSVRDDSETATSGNAEITSTTATFSSIGFDSGALFRYGRLRMGNAVGSEQINLAIPITAEYYNGTAFTTNTADNCTSFVAANFNLGSYTGSLTSALLDTPSLSHIVPGGAFTAGVGSLTLTKPTSPVTGTVQLCVDLDGAVPTDGTCVATTPASKSWLQGNWIGSSNYDKDPRSRAAFGIYGGQPRNFIYLRENY